MDSLKAQCGNERTKDENICCLHPVLKRSEWDGIKFGETAIKVPSFLRFTSCASSSRVFFFCFKYIFVVSKKFFPWAFSAHFSIPPTIDWNCEGASKALKRVFVVLLKHNAEVMPVKKSEFANFLCCAGWACLGARCLPIPDDCMALNVKRFGVFWLNNWSDSVRMNLPLLIFMEPVTSDNCIILLIYVTCRHERKQKCCQQVWYSMKRRWSHRLCQWKVRMTSVSTSCEEIAQTIDSRTIETSNYLHPP